MEIARYWRMNHQRYNMTGSQCARCGKRYVSPRPVCDACQHENDMSGKDAVQQVSTAVREPAHK